VLPADDEVAPPSVVAVAIEPAGEVLELDPHALPAQRRSTVGETGLHTLHIEAESLGDKREDVDHLGPSQTSSTARHSLPRCRAAAAASGMLEEAVGQKIPSSR